MRLKNLNSVLLLFLHSLVVFSQANEKTLLFNSITTEHGLSNNVVYDILQDSEGFMWFATDNGLNRYDGYSVKKFFHNPNSTNGLSSSVVRSLKEDLYGNLWVGTKNGLNLYDRTANKFIRINALDNSVVKNKEIMKISLDLEGNLWINTLNDIIKFNPKTYRYKVIYSSDYPPFMIVNKREVYFNSKEKISSYNTITEKLKYIINAPELRNKFIGIGNLSKKLWFPSNFKRGMDSIKLLEIPSLPEKLEPNSLIEVNDSIAWIGSNKGLFEYNLNTNSITEINLSKSSLTKQIRSFYKDNFGGVWIGTLGGVLHYDSNRKMFKHLDLDKSIDDVVMGLCTSKSGIYVNAFGNGLYFLNNDAAKPLKIEVPNSMVESLKHIWDIKEIPESEFPLWIATNSGLICFNPIKMNFETIQLPISELDKNISFSILKTDQDYVWVSSYRAIHQINKKSRKVEASISLNKHMKHSGVQKLEMLGHYIFIATEGEGLLAYNRNSDTTSKVKLNSNNDSTIEFKTPIWDLFASSNGLWIGTNQGLYKLSLEDMVIRPVLSDDQVIFSIVADEKGTLWMGSDRGIKMYNPLNKVSRYFTNKNGLKNLEFNRKSVIKNKNGDLWFGGTNGLTVLNPNRIKKDNINKPFVHITHLKAIASDTTVSITNFEKPITIPWKYNTIEISYVGLNYTNSSQNTYKYKMVGYDPDWVSISQPTAARYVKLPVGDYKFNVVAANNDGVFNNQGKTITIKIKPPLWRTNLAYTIYLLSVFGLLKLFQSLKKSRLRVKEVEKEKTLIAKKVERVSITLNNKTKLYLDQLIYIKSDGNYLEFITETKPIIDRNKLKDILAELPPNFVRVHRSYVINKNFIDSLNSTTIFISPNIEIPLSRTFKSNLS